MFRYDLNHSAWVLNKANFILRTFEKYMESKIKATAEGMIYIKPSVIVSLKRPNALEGAKVLGKPLVINASQICFLAHNTEGKVTFFLTNGFEICVNIFYDEAEKIFSAAKSCLDKEI